MNRQEICWTDHHAKSDRQIIELPSCLVSKRRQPARIDLSAIDELSKDFLRRTDVIIPPPETQPMTEQIAEELARFRDETARAYEEIGVNVLISAERVRLELGLNWHDIKNSNGELIKVRIRGPRAKEYVCTQDFNHPNIRRETRRIVSQSTFNTRLMVLTEYIPGACTLTESKKEIHNRAGIILEALEGSIYICDSGLCHGDIKPENILIKPNGQALLADLESLTIKDQAAPGDEFYTGRYYDRQFYELSNPDEARDVFAWALTILNSISNHIYLEIIRLRQCSKFKKMSLPERYVQISTAIDRGGLKDQVLCDVLKRCFCDKRTQRPSLREVYNAVTAYKETL